MPMPASHPTDHVFAYGSLVRDLAGGEPVDMRAAYLRDHRRAWNVAMDNSLTLPGYKYYLDAEDASRPEVFVTFLNLLPAPGHRVNGMLVPVGAEQLVELDRRERNYTRREVTASIEPVAEGRVWSYFGKPEACRRFAAGVHAARAVIDEAYLERVRAGFEALSDDALAEFEQSTDAHGCRTLRLLRVDLG
jgi:cation transport regulator ChaC